MRRREFMAASAAFAAGAMIKPVKTFAAIPGAVSTGPLPDYVGAGATAAIRPFPLTDVSLGAGLLKEKQERVLSFLRGYDERRFLVLFNRLAGRPNPKGRSHRPLIVSRDRSGFALAIAAAINPMNIGCG